MAIRRYFCHGCHSQGDQLELRAAATKLPLHQAAIACHEHAEWICAIGWAAMFRGFGADDDHAGHRSVTPRKRSSQEKTEPEVATGTRSALSIENIPSIIVIQGASIILITLTVKCSEPEHQSIKTWIEAEVVATITPAAWKLFHQHS